MIKMTHHDEEKVYDIRQAMGKPYKDLDYIAHSWLNAYKNSPEMSLPGLTDRDYYHFQHSILNQVIPAASVAGSCYMCHTPDDLFTYRGYLVAEAFEDFPPIIHWLQVKKEHKRQGVATALLRQFITDFDLQDEPAFIYTHSSTDMKRKYAIREQFREAGIRLLYIPWFKTPMNRPGWKG